MSRRNTDVFLVDFYFLIENFFKMWYDVFDIFDWGDFMALSLSSRSMDMTKGPLFRKMLLFILPLMATHLLQVFYNAADVMIVGLSSDPDAVGAVGSSGAYLNLIINIFIGFSIGTDVVVARNIGAKNADGVSKAVHTSICMSVIFGLLGSIVGIAAAYPIYIAMGYTDNLLVLSLRYSYIYLIGLPFASLTNFLSAIMRAKGDTKTPLYVMLTTGLLNVLLNLFFVLALKMTVEGVAIATAVANAVSACILLFFLLRDSGMCRVFFRKLRLSKNAFLEICHIGFPSGIQNSFFSISNMLIQSSILQVNNAIAPIGAAYEPVIKGNAAVMSLENFSFAALNSVSQAASTFTSQNVGIKDFRRVKKVLSVASLIAAALSLAVTAILIILRDPLLALYGVTNADDILSQLAYDTAMKRIWWKWIPFFLIALMNTAAGVLRGLGRSMTSAAFSLVGTCVFRVVWIYTVFAFFGTLESIYLSYGFSWLITGTAFYITVGVILKKKTREQAQNELLSIDD